MPDIYEECRGNLARLADWYAQREGSRNEATTRLHLVDELFLGSLAWSKDDLELEHSYGGEYADYTFSITRAVLIVEAKKEGVYFELPAGTSRREHAITSLSRDYPEVKAALEQVAGYCQSRGVPLAVVSNGHQLIAFVAVRNDGTPPLAGRALVFASLQDMLEHFLELWQALSKPALTENRLAERLLGTASSNLPPKLSASIVDYPGIRIRNTFQADLQIVSELVIEDVVRARDIETPFLLECYCKSGALSQYALVSKSILQARYAALFDANSGGVTLLPAADRAGISAEMLAESISRRPILIIGDVGVGKTMFIRNLMKVEAPEVFENAITLYLDLGSRATLTADLRNVILSEIESQLLTDYGIDVYERNLIRGIYNLDLERFSRGLYSDLREANPTLYKEREISYLEGKLAIRDEHLRHTLEHLTRGRQKQVVIFLDNTDQRDDQTQQNAFLIAQELAEQWPATVFLTLRPETFHRSIKRGALSGYHPKAFAIYPPRVDHVITRRLTFARRIAAGELPLASLPTGIQLRLANLETLISVFIESLERNRDLVELIDNVASGNVRLALDLVRGFFGSGHVDTAKIVDIHSESGDYYIPVHEFLRAVIYGDNEHYDPTSSPIANLFDVASGDPREHFLLPLTIATLAAYTGPGSEEGFVETQYLFERLQGLGFVPEQIDAAVVRAQRHKLVETASRRVLRMGEEIPASVRVTAAGVYHVNRLIRLFTYLDAVIVDTPVLERGARNGIKDVRNLEARLARAELFRAYLDSQWTDRLRQQAVFDWPAISQALIADMQDVARRAQRRTLSNQRAAERRD